MGSAATILERLNAHGAPARRKKPKRVRMPQAFKAHTCVLLSLDSAAKSGWALWLRGKLVDSGEVRTRKVVVVKRAVELAQAEGLPVMVVREKWSPGGWKTYQTPIGLGAGWGEWRIALRAHGVPSTRVEEIFPATWKSAVLSGGNMTREESLAAAMRYVEARFHIKAKPDQAVAIVIGVWGIHSGEVGARLARYSQTPPKKRRELEI
jgi:hypothetical protein